MPNIKQIQSVEEGQSTVQNYDLDNRYIELTGTSGTLTADQLALLQASTKNYILYNSSMYRLRYDNGSQLYYQCLKSNKYLCYFNIVISSRAYTYTEISLEDNDTKVTQSSTTVDGWRKILLHYDYSSNNPTAAVTTATNQVYASVGISANPKTGAIRATQYNVADGVTLVYDSTNKCLNFNF